MSAIAGIYYRDGRPINPADLGRMVDSLAHRGPDGIHVWHQGSTGLGHCMLYTTPESRYETLPFINDSAQVVITADARIDNREELIASLQLTGLPVAEMTDSQLILAAYQKWGQRCPEKLLGVFAFAIWDGHKQQLFCARDQMGVKPFYYALSARDFFFATEIKAILSQLPTPFRLNEVRVADHLAPFLEDKRHTFYQNIYRLPPAHAMCIEVDKVTEQVYWALNPQEELILASDNEYAEAFEAVFTNAVRRCLRSAYPVGSQLSGGLDSSSITCVARNLLTNSKQGKLQTFSFTFDEDAPCYEVPYINHVVAQNGVIPHFARGDQSGPFTYLDLFLRCADEPFHLPNFFQSWDLYKFTQNQGVRVVLDGFDGDTTVSHGWSYLTQLAASGQWGSFSREAAAASSRHQKVSSRGLLKRHGIPLLQQRVRKGQWLHVARDVNGIAKHFAVDRWQLLYYYALRPAISTIMRRLQNQANNASVTMQALNPLLNERFTGHIGLLERMQTLAGPRLALHQTERESHWYALTTGLFPYALEKMDSLAAPFALDVRHPFMDRQLIEFCLALPGGQKRNQGWDRFVLRRAMGDILPTEVQWRPGKADFTTNFLKGMLRYDRIRLDELLLGDQLCVSNYVNVDKLRQSYRQLITTESDPNNLALSIWLVIALEMWLRSAPVTP